jgi:hypothetical protein
VHSIVSSPLLGHKSGGITILALGREQNSTQLIILMGRIDGGGPFAISQLFILDEFMKRIQYDTKKTQKPRPCDYFDLICGTGTGR